MLYATLDLETLGLFEEGGRGPTKMIQFSIVVENTDRPDIPVEELPHLTVIVSQKEYSGEPYALWLNGWILKEIDTHQKNQWRPIEKREETKYPVVTLEELIPMVHEFLSKHFPKGKINLAGKNVSNFDFQFLPLSLQRRFHHRMLDPAGSFLDFGETRSPSITDLCDRFGLGAVTHDALDDNYMVIKLFRIAMKLGYIRNTPKVKETPS